MRNLIEELAEVIRKHPAFEEATPCFVSLYKIEQQYGGPEEGGWWYDVLEHKGSIPFTTRTDAEVFLEAARALVEKKNRAEAPSRAKAMASLPDIETAYHDEGWIPQGWGDGGEWEVRIEDKSGELDHTNQGRPHYE